MELSREVIDRVLNSIVGTNEHRSKIIYEILIETSCKTSELSDIKIKEISRDKIKFYGRVVPISKQLSKSIYQYIEENNLQSESFLFSTRQSNKISSKRIRQIVHETSMQLIGSKIDPKEIRKFSIQNKLRTKELDEVKNEAGLKRLDKRKFLTNEQINEIEKNIDDKRTYLIFNLLLNNIKSSEIVNFKVEDILDVNVPKDIVDKLEKFAIYNKVSFGEYLFKTRINTHLSKVMVYKIITALGKKSGVELTPQILNNTAIANAISSKNPDTELNALGVKTRAFHLHGGFIKNE
jgi:integrase